MKRQQRERTWHRGRNMTKENDQLTSTRVGGKLINLYGAFECAFHMFACMAYVLNLKSMLVWCMLVVRLNDEMKSLDKFHFQIFLSGIELTMMLRMVY